MIIFGQFLKNVSRCIHKINNKSFTETTYSGKGRQDTYKSEEELWWNRAVWCGFEWSGGEVSFS